MILRKPYAFIIKHFRIIHLILLACFIFLFISINDIYTLFKSLEQTKTYIYSGASVYINSTVYLFIGIGLILSGIVYWLLKEKKKPTKLYFFMMVYFVLLIISFVFMFNRLTTIQETMFDVDQIILMKDISLISTLPCYVFFTFCGLRGIGFNIKQFNFSKDVSELQIAAEDSEEFEVLIGQNNYKYARAIRRTLRETKYYIKENKFLLTVVFTIILVITAGFGYYYYSKYYKNLNQDDAAAVNGITYTINKAYVTSRDYNGYEVRKNYKFVVVNMDLFNSTQINKTINPDQVELVIGDLTFRPTYNYNGKFYDLGNPYDEDVVLLPQNYYNYTFTYEIPSSTVVNNLIVRIYNGVEDTVSNVVGKYKKFSINATKIDSEMSYYEKNLSEYVNTNVEGVNQFDVMITDYSIQDTYDNKFVRCDSISSCKIMSNVISSTKSSLNTMMVVGYRANLYDDAYFLKKFNTINKIFGAFAYIRYETDTSNYLQKVEVVPNSIADNKVFFIVPRTIKNAKFISIEFYFRNDTYIVQLMNAYSGLNQSQTTE